MHIVFQYCDAYWRSRLSLNLKKRSCWCSNCPCLIAYYIHTHKYTRECAHTHACTHTRARACIHIDTHRDHTKTYRQTDRARERHRHRHREARSNNNQPNTITQPVQKEKWNESEHFLDSVKSEGIYHSLNITGNKWQRRCSTKPKRDRQTDRQTET